MDDLIAFIRARLDDDERYVRAVKAAGERLKANPDPRMTEFGKGTIDAFLDNWDDLGEFTRWKSAVPSDLDRLLREVEAKRAVLGAYVSAATCDRLPQTEAYLDGYCSAMEVALKALAVAWSDHPDYPR